MKLQIQPGSLRVRIDEAELAALLGGEPLLLRLGLGSEVLVSLTVMMAARLSLVIEPGWQLNLPESELRDYIITLPRRDALTLHVSRPGEEPLRLDFEVDVRDSLQVRGHRRRR